MDEFADYNRSVVNTTFVGDFSPWFITGQVLKILVAMLVMTCDVMVMYATVGLKKADVKYFHLMNWSLVDFLRCVISPHVLFLVVVNPNSEEDEGFYQNLICWVLQAESATILIISVTVFLLTVDWIIEVCTPWLQTYKNKAVVIKIVFYVFAGLYFWYASMFCLSNWRQIHHTSVLIVLKLLTLFILLLYVCYSICKKIRHVTLKFDFRIILPTVFVLSWLPTLIVNLLVDISSDHKLIIGYYFFAECFSLVNAIVNVYVLFKCEEEFKPKFVDFVKCNCQCR
ncbi:hypothetical protein Zmor_025168 [Zophobas morio]|uniref:G-protein coupled receptors family 1 profile domain-containing protein n=1 Tax=Zophobas morio TaxID=2755281 RepID=A0AA38HW67_9CUCU|nr:hypothetical protein Zmor_025168 [Zophobas morio]